jgi:glutathione S-transferase
MATFTLPSSYGYTLLSCTVLPFITSTVMGGMVMQARDKYSVPYPNLYATPGFHKQADEFNRVQRGHQNLFETLPIFIALALVGGIKHPLTATGAGILYCLGNVCFLCGYADTSLDVKLARYKKGGALKHVGFLVAMGTCISIAGTINGWW